MFRVVSCKKERKKKERKKKKSICKAIHDSTHPCGQTRQVKQSRTDTSCNPSHQDRRFIKLFRSHDLPSKFSAITSRMCDRRNRAMKHMYVSPLLKTFFVVSAVVPDFIFIEDHTDFKMLVLLHHNANELFAVRQHVKFLS